MVQIDNLTHDNQILIRDLEEINIKYENLKEVIFI